MASRVPGDQKYETTGVMSPEGHFTVDNPGVLRKALKVLIGERLLISFEKFKYKRSDAQNRWMWGVCVTCVRAWMKETTGEVKTPDEVYLWLRIAVLGQRATVSEVMGVEVITMTGKRFSQMTTKEFSDAVEIIIREMDEKGCFIPLPQDKKPNVFTDFVEDN